tara:strand:- start:1445 stop:1663 length:219 start_codon:yes stop_codon:yes gene_type:complete
MKIKEIIEELKKEHPLSKKYKYRVGSDDGGRTLEIYDVPHRHAHKVRKEIPMRYKGIRTIVFYREEREKDDE